MATNKPQTVRKATEVMSVPSMRFISNTPPSCGELGEGPLSLAHRSSRSFRSPERGRHSGSMAALSRHLSVSPGVD